MNHFHPWKIEVISPVVALVINELVSVQYRISRTLKIPSSNKISISAFLRPDEWYFSAQSFHFAFKKETTSFLRFSADFLYIFSFAFLSCLYIFQFSKKSESHESSTFSKASLIKSRWSWSKKGFVCIYFALIFLSAFMIWYIGISFSNISFVFPTGFNSNLSVLDSAYFCVNSWKLLLITIKFKN